LPIFPLIQVKAGLMPQLDIHQKGMAIFDNFDQVRGNLTPDRAGHRDQPFFVPGFDITSFVDALRLNQVHQDIQDDPPVLLRRYGQKLDHQPGPVDIGDKSRHTIGLRINQPVGIGIRRLFQGQAAGHGAAETPPPKLFINWIIGVPGQQTDLYLGFTVVNSPGHKTGLTVPNIDHIAILRLSFYPGNRAGEDPGMAIVDGFLSILFENNLGYYHVVYSLAGFVSRILPNYYKLS
jgi:hypothetical protein